MTPPSKGMRRSSKRTTKGYESTCSAPYATSLGEGAVFRYAGFSAFRRASARPTLVA
jgi:hypothetical protein